jgi:magnesium transporter
MSTLRPRYNKPGTAPGLQALRVESPSAVLSVFDFNRDAYVEEHDVGLERCRALLLSKNVTWVHVQGTPDLSTLRSLAEAFELHQLAIEDIVSDQRPKLEMFEKQLFAVLDWPRVRGASIEHTQVSLFLGQSYVVSFCSGTSDPFGPVRERIKAEPPGRIRERGAHYLFYALVDLVIDEAFPALEHVSELLENLESRLLEKPDRSALRGIHRLKRTLIVLRKQLWPHREVAHALMRGEHALIAAKTRPYFADCYDHVAQALDLIESYREMASSLQDLYLTSVSNGMNEIMKVLTMIATLFIPLSFFTGLYGMNFDRSSPWNMPELGARYGYPVLLVFLSLVAAGMVVYFRRKRWI